MSVVLPPGLAVVCVLLAADGVFAVVEAFPWLEVVWETLSWPSGLFLYKRSNECVRLTFYLPWIPSFISPIASQSTERNKAYLVMISFLYFKKGLSKYRENILE